VLPPIAAIVVALWSRNVYLALGLAVLISESLIAQFNVGLGVLGGIDRTVAVFSSAGNTRIILFCLIIGALIAYMQKSGGIAATVERLHSSGYAATPRRAGLISAFSGVLIFVETNVSLLASGVLGRPLFDRLRLSRERLAYIIDSTCAPVSVLILFNGWGAYVAGLLANNGVSDEFGVLFNTIALNFYAWFALAAVFATVLMGRTFGSLAQVERELLAGGGAHKTRNQQRTDPDDAPGHSMYMVGPVLVLIVGALGFMVWTGGGDITKGSGSQAILWAVTLATFVAGVCYRHSGRGRGRIVDVGMQGMGELLPAVTVILLALVLGASLQALGTGQFITTAAASISVPFVIPALLFIVAGVTSFTTGTSWGTYGILIPVAIPMALGADLPLSLVVAAVMGGGVFGDHCSPISDTTIIASLAAGCDHVDHVRTQMPYALLIGVVSVVAYLLAGLLAL